MISPTKSALDTRVLTVEVYSLGCSALRRTFVMVLRMIRDQLVLRLRIGRNTHIELFWYPSLIRAKPLANYRGSLISN